VLPQVLPAQLACSRLFARALELRSNICSATLSTFYNNLTISTASSKCIQLSFQNSSKKFKAGSSNSVHFIAGISGCNDSVHFIAGISGCNDSVHFIAGISGCNDSAHFIFHYRIGTFTQGENMSSRLDKLLSEYKIASRSECKKIIKKGRITVNGVVASDASMTVEPDTDEIALDGAVIACQEFEYFMLNKPSGCLTATRDPRQPTVMDYLPDSRRRDLSPVGRLDKDTEGLLLITNDGALNHRLLSPHHHVSKTYEAIIDGIMTPDEVKAFETGLDIGEKKPTAPAVLKIIDDNFPIGNAAVTKNTVGSKVLVTITEGKYHEIKRMFLKFGLTVLYLKRISMGALVLDSTLAPGECRPLTKSEIDSLQ
jgi:16S rRNA pseudouridine516 synthase